MNVYENDVFTQPDDLEYALSCYLKAETPRLCAELPMNKVIFTGMGSSYSCCLNISSLLRNCGVNALAMPVSELLHYEMETLNKDTLLFVVSQSGKSGEVAALCEALPRACKMAALTNGPDSPLGMRADFLFDMCAPAEQAVSTRTYLAPLMFMYIAGKAMTGGWNEAALEKLYASIGYLRESLVSFEEVSGEMDGFFGGPPNIVLIGRGCSMPTVDAGALFIKEVAKYPSIAYEAGQFRHGPMEMAGPEFSAMVFAPKGRTYGLQRDLAHKLAAMGGRIAFITDEPADEAASGILTVPQRYADEETAPFVNITPVQAFANLTAKRKGLKVGSFLYGSKVTTGQ